MKKFALTCLAGSWVLVLYWVYDGTTGNYAFGNGPGWMAASFAPLLAIVGLVAAIIYRVRVRRSRQSLHSH